MSDHLQQNRTRRTALPCPTCLGSGGGEHEKDFGGRHPVIRWDRCETCDGTGQVLVTTSINPSAPNFYECCESCGGEGRISTQVDNAR